MQEATDGHDQTAPADQGRLKIEAFNLRAASSCGPARATFDVKITFPDGAGTLTVKNYKLMRRGSAGDGHTAGYWVCPPSARNERGPGFHRYAELDGPWVSRLLDQALALYRADGHVDEWSPPEVPFYPERPEDKQVERQPLMKMPDDLLIIGRTDEGIQGVKVPPVRLGSRFN